MKKTKVSENIFWCNDKTRICKKCGHYFFVTTNKKKCPFCIMEAKDEYRFTGRD